MSLKYLKSIKSFHFEVQQKRFLSVCLKPIKQLVRFEGPDTQKFLQGLTTQNVTLKKPFYTGFLNTSGRVLFDAFCYPESLTNTEVSTPNQKLLIEVEKFRIEEFLKHVKKYKLRYKCNVTAVDPEELSVQVGWEQDAEKVMSDKHSYPSMWDPRFQGPMLSRRVVSSYACSSDVALEEYMAFRYRHGIAEGSMEIAPGSAFPMESNLDWMKGIDFYKGCYLGQELTVRTYHTGVTRKRILPFMIEESSRIADIQTSSKLGLRASSAGRVSSRSPGKVLATQGIYGLAMVRLEYLNQPLMCNGVPIRIMNEIWNEQLQPSDTKTEN
ncbi:iron-sulfur cluster biogenesis protein [Schizosaccharomyces cryophilus OY26]|uniref:Iron-sulfur cluster biogenesis protein n=1 Tax=Schizosaccharomyces cryophilus (strain OY26 / ATCC MYA-4695 / CBS 11777 / NBRC 106824 / NRRL Y48691) TaxID=653667 RepID=S9VYU2_SCHCR|nr:iron-sulfur cluster biogenesis protein [Schizosaccharomyces cryophilus OY26]EPY51379.1 iron-sulfur cluster biogenesis protein [Schizosaccharomyces cryophilus OY26]